MRKKFLKEVSMKDMLLYLLKKSWIIVMVAIMALVISLMGSYMILDKESNMDVIEIGDETIYELIDGNYVYTTLVHVRAKPTTNVISMGSYLETMISNEAITNAIESLGLQENYIDIFSKMDWEIIGENIKFKIKSPIQEVDGYTWEQVLAEVIKQGELTVKKYFDNVEELIVIDEPYIENSIINIEEVKTNTDINISSVVLVVLVSMILACGSILVCFLLKDNIICEEEIEKNLDIPVLVVVEKRNVKKS